MIRLFGEGCFYERGRIYLGSMWMSHCMGCGAALPVAMVEEWDAKGFIPVSVKPQPLKDTGSDYTETNDTEV